MSHALKYYDIRYNEVEDKWEIWFCTWLPEDCEFESDFKEKYITSRDTEDEAIAFVNNDNDRLV